MTARDSIDGFFLKRFDKPSDLLCCAFGLKNSEIDTYFALLSGSKTVEEIKSIVRRDRSTIQRVLKKLLDNGLVERDSKHFDRGGYYYVYRAISTDEVKSQILEQLEKWYSETKRFLMGTWPEPPR